MWILTGDKKETAINIGYSSELITKNDTIFISHNDHLRELNLVESVSDEVRSNNSYNLPDSFDIYTINLDDYVGYLMLQQCLNIKLDGDFKTKLDAINNLNILKNAKESLNSTMTFLDKQ